MLCHKPWTQSYKEISASGVHKRGPFIQRRLIHSGERNHDLYLQNVPFIHLPLHIPSKQCIMLGFAVIITHQERLHIHSLLSDPTHAAREPSCDVHNGRLYDCRVPPTAGRVVRETRVHMVLCGFSIILSLTHTPIHTHRHTHPAFSNRLKIQYALPFCPSSRRWPLTWVSLVTRTARTIMWPLASFPDGCVLQLRWLNAAILWVLNKWRIICSVKIITLIINATNFTAF